MCSPLFRYEQNFQVLAKAFENLGLQVCEAEGGYFCVVDCSSAQLTDYDFTRLLLERIKVGGMPMKAFYVPSAESDGAPPPPEHLVRFAICKDAATVAEAARRIEGLVL